MLSDKIQVAVVGLGVGEQHLAALLTHPKVEIVAVCDLKQEKIFSILNKYNLSHAISKNFQQIVENKNINLVSIASFDDAHFSQVIDCLHYGKHVFVEKPLCQTHAQLKKIYTQWKKNKLGLSSNLVLRKAPLYVWLDNAITSGEIGDVYAIDMDYLYGRVHKITEGWRTNVDDYSVMAGGGIHLIDLMLNFLKEMPSKVQSCSNKIATKNTAFRYHDFHSSIFHFKNNVIARVTANFGCMHHHQHVIRIFGTKGTVIYDDMGPRIHRARTENACAKSLDLQPKPAHKGCLLLDFVNIVLSGNIEKTALAEFDLMSVVIAADRALVFDNHPIEITYVSRETCHVNG